jgi:hypothetical protein
MPVITPLTSNTLHRSPGNTTPLTLIGPIKHQIVHSLPNIHPPIIRQPIVRVLRQLNTVAVKIERRALDFSIDEGAD